MFKQLTTSLNSIANELRKISNSLIIIEMAMLKSKDIDYKELKAISEEDKEEIHSNMNRYNECD